MQKIAYVILTWNSAPVIRRCVESLYQMAGYCAQVIIVDNGSTDGTLDVLKSLEGRAPSQVRLQVLPLAKNCGTTLPRNLGFAEVHADADFICVLDSDTQMNGPAMDALVAACSTHPSCGIVGPQLVSPSGAVQPSARNFPTLAEKLLKALPLKTLNRKGEALEAPSLVPGPSGLVPVDYLMSACWVFRPALLTAVGGLDEKIFYAPEDAEFCIRVAKAGYRVLYCPQARILHEWQRLSRKKLFSKHNWEHIKGLCHLFIKHRYLFSAAKLRQSYP